VHQDTGSARIAGVDLGDKLSVICTIAGDTGEILERTSVRTTLTAFEEYFARSEPMRVALEAGTHSPWASRTIAACGHEVLTANARQVRLVYASRRKSDHVDAEKLARLARLDARLLAPIEHRTEATQRALATLRARRALIRARTLLVNHARGSLKSFGYRLPKCATEAFPRIARARLPEGLAPALSPILDGITNLNEQIKLHELQLQRMATDAYPETALLTQVHGVGLTTALTFILTLETPARFPSSRAVGAYLGLTPGRRQSGDRDTQQHITKEGDQTLRSLLVQCAHQILRRGAPDSDLRRHGLHIARSGTKEAKRIAVIAVARKLAIILYALWSTGEVYEPLRNATKPAPDATLDVPASPPPTDHQEPARPS